MRILTNANSAATKNPLTRTSTRAVRILERSEKSGIGFEKISAE
jgi:hypothetical protein